MVRLLEIQITCETIVMMPSACGFHDHIAEKMLGIVNSSRNRGVGVDLIP